MTLHEQNKHTFLEPVFQEIAGLCRWLDEHALPLWFRDGFDRNLGLFHERLDMQGQPITDVPRRLLVQCRQISIYAYATLRGRLNVRGQLIETYERMRALYLVPEKRGHWRFSVTPRGASHDNRLDAYSLAFLIFALAWLYRLNPSEQYLIDAEDIFVVLDTELSAGGEGVRPVLTQSDDTLAQNPNMHLFEACLALYEAAGRPQDLLRAERLADLFEQKMFDHRRQALPEKHEAGWRIWEPAHNWFEPGHHFEWSWLLRQFERLGARDVSGLVEKLLPPALRVGLDQNSVVIEQIGLERNFRIDSSRNWGTCEFIKCCSYEYQEASWRRDEAAAEIWAQRTLAGLQALRCVFLSTPFPGLWHDRVDRDYQPITDYAPASSFYHIGFAIAEAERIFTRFVPEKIAFAGSKKPVLFLDRDGVINVDIAYAFRPEQISFVPGIFELVQKANRDGKTVIVVTNQSGVARSYFSESDVIALHAWMNDEFRKQGAFISAFYHCPYLEGADTLLYDRIDHFDRKPEIGMLQRAALDWNIDVPKSLLLGDRPSDCLAAERFGIQSLLFEGDHQFSLAYLDALKY